MNKIITFTEFLEENNQLLEKQSRLYDKQVIVESLLTDLRKRQDQINPSKFSSKVVKIK